MFRDRLDAGEKLGRQLSGYAGREDLIVLGIPRGGAAVGYSIARKLSCPLDVVISKKIPYPEYREVAIGAASENSVILDDYAIKTIGISQDYLERETDRIKAEVAGRYSELTGRSEFPDISRKTAVVTDDGVATGYTFLAALEFVKSRNPEKIIAAVPVASPEISRSIEKLVDESFILLQEDIGAVSRFYQDFRQLEDREVKRFLKKANRYGGEKCGLSQKIR